MSPTKIRPMGGPGAHGPVPSLADCAVPFEGERRRRCALI